MGLKPKDIWDMHLWEYNSFAKGFELKQKQKSSECVLTGYYSAYFINSKKPKSPNDIIAELYKKPLDISNELEKIKRIKELDKGGKI